jgi:hypothetical protein
MEQPVQYKEWSCTRCGVRTTTPLSIGMLQCAYHPHRDGPLRPVYRPWTQTAPYFKRIAGGCVACTTTYTGTDHLVSAYRERGCTAVDHVGPHEDFIEMLSSRPYEVIPLDIFDADPAHYNVAVNAHHIMRTQTPSMSGAASVLRVNTQQQMVGADGDTPRFLEMRLHGPDPLDCGIPDADAAAYRSVVLSLESLYNECAERHNYASFQTSNWKRKLLYANRRELPDPNDKDGGMSAGVVKMTEEDLFTRELYSTAAACDDGDIGEEFVPFAIVPRVETASMRVFSSSSK